MLATLSEPDRSILILSSLRVCASACGRPTRTLISMLCSLFFAVSSFTGILLCLCVRKSMSGVELFKRINKLLFFLILVNKARAIFGQGNGEWCAFIARHDGGVQVCLLRIKPIFHAHICVFVYVFAQLSRHGGRIVPSTPFGFPFLSPSLSLFSMYRGPAQLSFDPMRSFN